VGASSAPYIDSQLPVYRAIALEAHAAMTEANAVSRRPIPGHPGRAEIIPDPTRKSFKQALVCVVFVGVYLDALLHIRGSQELGREVYAGIEEQELENRLRRLGVVDQRTLDLAVNYRLARREIVHERALRPRPTDAALRVIQDEADSAIELLSLAEKLVKVRG